MAFEEVKSEWQFNADVKGIIILQAMSNFVLMHLLEITLVYFICCL
jgi:hypothetical protein